MNVFSFIVVFIIFWWLSFFVVLPIGVRGQFEDEAGVEEGTEEGAPANPMIGKKVLWASVIALPLTVVTLLTLPPLLESLY